MQPGRVWSAEKAAVEGIQDDPAPLFLLPLIRLLVASCPPWIPNDVDHLWTRVGGGHYQRRWYRRHSREDDLSYQ